MSRFVLSNKAKNDLSEIAKYTYKTWGRQQLESYIRGMHEVFEGIAAGTLKGQIYDLKKGYKKYYIGKHIIFFRQLSTDTIQVVRILHQSMDVGSHI
jgi:toxin ParE1/3/4